MQRTPPQQSLGDAVVSPPTKRLCLNDSPLSQAEDLSSVKQDEIMSLLTKVLAEVTEIRKNNTDMQKSLEFYIKKNEEMNDRIVTLEGEKVGRQMYIQNLESRLDESERHARSTCLEIRGVPSKPKETKQDLSDLVEKLQSKIRINVQPNMIKDIYRIRAKLNEERPLVVDFTTSIMKDNTLQAVKKYNAANTTDRLNTNILGIEGKKSPVFVSEFLTPKAKRLYFLARDVARTCGFDFCWSKNGRIFLRKAEGSAPIIVTNEQQLDDLKQKTD